MANITMRLKDVIDAADGNIGLDNYPIFDSKYRATLNQKIINRYTNREIAHESIDMFQLAMRRAMNENMPYFNKLYESELVKFDPLVTVEMVTDGESESTAANESTGTSASESKGDAYSRSVNSEFPQQQLSGSKDYATNANDTTSENTAEVDAEESSTSNQNVEAKNTSRTKGYQGVPSDLIMAYRASLLNIDVQVIDSLADCFMMVMSTPSDFFDNRNYFFNS